MPDGDSITDRLRRLSMTPAEEYELSAVAREKALEMAKVRKESKDRGEDWNFDQRNMRPGGPPQQQQSYQRRDVRRRDWDDEDDNNFGRRSNYGDRNDFQDRRRDSGFRQTQPPRRNQYEEEDGPQDYEVAMQKLKERMDEIKGRRVEVERTQSRTKKHVEEGADFDSSERSSESSKLS